MAKKKNGKSNGHSNGNGKSEFSKRNKSLLGLTQFLRRR